MSTRTFAVIACFVLGGCSSSSTDVTTTTDAGSAGDAASATDSANGACTSIANGGSFVIPVEVASDPPAATGGTIADGTYFLTADQTFTGVGGPTDTFPPGTKTTYVFSGGSLEEVTQTGDGPERRASGTVLTTGTAISFALGCSTADAGAGDAGAGPATYTATPTTIIMYSPAGSFTFSTTLTKQ